MSYKTAEPGAGWEWFVQGWSLFIKNPGMWLVLTIILMVILFVLNVIPFIGGIAAALIGPALAGGVMYAAREQDAGRNMDVAQLFQAFTDKTRTAPMLMLGAAPAVTSLIFAVAFGSIFALAVFGMASHGGVSSAIGFGSLVLFVLIGLPLMVLVSAGLFYGTPRVMLDGEEPVAAFKESLKACLVNVVPLLIFGVIYVVAAVIATIPFGLGWLLLCPVSLAAMYCSYKEVFGGIGGAPRVSKKTPA